MCWWRLHSVDRKISDPMPSWWPNFQDSFEFLIIKQAHSFFPANFWRAMKRPAAKPALRRRLSVKRPAKATGKGDVLSDFHQSFQEKHLSEDQHREKAGVVMKVYQLSRVLHIVFWNL